MWLDPAGRTVTFFSLAVWCHYREIDRDRKWAKAISCHGSKASNNVSSSSVKACWQQECVNIVSCLRCLFSLLLILLEMHLTRNYLLCILMQCSVSSRLSNSHHGFHSRVMLLHTDIYLWVLSVMQLLLQLWYGCFSFWLLPGLMWLVLLDEL